MYYIYRIIWSQTDRDTVIIKADTREHAEAIVFKKWGGPNGACYTEQVGKTKTLIKA